MSKFVFSSMKSEFLIVNKKSEPLRAFLSFVTKDKLLVDDFKPKLASRYTNLALVDHSVQVRYDKNWKLECAEKIDQSAFLICLVGITTHRSKPVAWEIDHGLSLGKRVLAFKLVDHKVRMPAVLVRNSITPVSLSAIDLTSTSAASGSKSAL